MTIVSRILIYSISFYRSVLSRRSGKFRKVVGSLIRSEIALSNCYTIVTHCARVIFFFPCRLLIVLITTFEGPEHTTELGEVRAHLSGCTLPIFHSPLSTINSPPGPGYVSNDGHHFTCKNPALLQPAFHV